MKNEPITARLATSTDRPLLADLQVRAWRRHGMLAIEEQVALLNSGVSALAFAHEQATGFLGLHVREPADGETWVEASIITLASGPAAGRTLAALLRAAAPELAAHSVAGIVCLTAENWLREALVDVGFKETDQVITYARSNRLPLSPAPQVAILRPAGAADADTMLEINGRAFGPLWRYDSATTLSWLFTADHAILAEWKGRPAGFALTSRTGGNGYDQLIRLATEPAAQGQGIGRQLVGDAIAFSQAAGSPGVALNTQMSNAVSRHLYEAMDFRVTGAPVRVMVYRIG